MIKVKWAARGKKKFTALDVVQVTWSGTENQAARKLEFTIPSNPYDKAFKKTMPKIALGDRVQLYEGKKLLFAGIVTSREKTAEIGTARYSAYDYMHYLLRSTVSRIFRDTTPKKATVSLCSQVGVKTGKLQDPKKNITKVIYKEKSIYDIIIALYRKAATKKTKYMPVMSGNKFCVVKKGTYTKVVLDQKKDITGATYHDTTDNMVNSVTIYNEDYSKAGTIKNDKQINKYGTYMQAYTKKKDEKAETAESAAKKLLVGITKEASVDAIGNIKCVAGKSLKIKDAATGLTGKFYITSDSHTFSNGVHMMKLELSWTNTMEEGADQEKVKEDD